MANNQYLTREAETAAETGGASGVGGKGFRQYSNPLDRTGFGRGALSVVGLGSSRALKAKETEGKKTGNQDRKNHKRNAQTLRKPR